MTGPLWYDADATACDSVRGLHGASVMARVALPDGLVIEGVGEIWSRTNGAKTKASVTLVFDYTATPYVLSSTRIHLTKEQVALILPSTDPVVNYRIDGEIRPALIARP